MPDTVPVSSIAPLERMRAELDEGWAELAQCRRLAAERNDPELLEEVELFTARMEFFEARAVDVLGAPPRVG